MAIITQRARQRTRDRSRAGNGASARCTPARDGFTLVSMIVAIVLLTVGILALGNANTNTIKHQNIAQNRTNAVAIARAYLEEVRSRNAWTLVSEPAVQVGPDGVEASGGVYSRRMQVSEVRNNLLLVELIVDFPRAGQPVRLTTYQYRGSGLAGAP